MTRKWKIINSLIAWLIFFSLVQPAYGAWDSLTAEVTFTAQTGVWNVEEPTPAADPTPEDQPAAASLTPQTTTSPAAPAAPEPETSTTPETPAPEDTTVTPTPEETPDPTPESPETPTPQENSETE